MTNSNGEENFTLLGLRLNWLGELFQLFDNGNPRLLFSEDYDSH